MGWIQTCLGLLQVQSRNNLQPQCKIIQRLYSSTIDPDLILYGKQDKFNGVHIDLQDLSDGVSPQTFKQLLSNSLRQWRKDNCSAAWLRVPIKQSQLIPTAAELGFVFHHAENQESMLCRWLLPDVPNKLPVFATHQVGVAGCVVRQDTKEVLVVQDRNRQFTLWKFPGGLAELGEDIADTAIREVYEETGIKAEFQGIILFRQQHKLPGAFGRSDFYFVCHMTPVNYDLHPDSFEISKCQWMDVDDLVRQTEASAITQRVASLLKIALEDGFDKVDIGSTEKFLSLYKGLEYRMYHSKIDIEAPKEYLHSLGVVGE